MLRNHLKSFLLALGVFFSLSLAAQADPVANLFRHQGDPVTGNPNGKVTVVEFFDYQCSHCVNMATTIQNIKKANPDVRFVFKDFPIRGEMSIQAALAAIAAHKQGKYYELSHQLLITNLSLTKTNILNIAKSLGINTEKLEKDMHSPGVISQLEANKALTRELNLNGTPAFFIGKTNAKTSNEVNYYLGEMSQGELQEAINKARA